MLDEGAEQYYVAKDTSKSPFDTNNIGFMIELKKSSGVSGEIEIDTDNARLFKITPVFSGSESFGIAARVRDVFKPLFSGMETPINASGGATLLHKP